jgi:hypothetical protein
VTPESLSGLALLRNRLKKAGAIAELLARGRARRRIGLVSARFRGGEPTWG